MKIGIYSICKNEESRIPKWIENLSGFDQVVVLDTGSTDNSIQLLQDAGIKVAQQLFEPFSFCEARNAALELLDEEIDWCLWLDFNETLEGFSKEAFLAEIDADTTAVCLHRHNYEEGVIYPGTESHPKVHKRNAYTWKYRIHEQLKIKEGFTRKEIPSEIKVIKAVSWSYNKMKFYEELCEYAVLHNEENLPHYVWFLTDYYNHQKQWERLKNACILYLEHTEPYKINFRIFVWRRLALASIELGDIKSAVMYSLSAMTECLYFREELFGSIRFLNKIGTEKNLDEFKSLANFFSSLYLTNK